MSDFVRYAIYHLPDEPDLAGFGAHWLGWDIVAAREVPRGSFEKAFDNTGIPDISAITATPSRYGFHATLKPPFRLAPGKRAEDLIAAIGELAARHAPVRLDGLKIAQMGRFLALVPKQDSTPLDAVAFDCVRQLDDFRAPATEADIEKRMKPGLSELRKSMLRTWGYPHVGPAFRFHMTLTGRLDPKTIETVARSVTAVLPGLPTPYWLRSVSLVGEGRDGRFRQIRRIALTGSS